jgi:hypothetical protein
MRCSVSLAPRWLGNKQNSTGPIVRSEPQEGSAQDHHWKNLGQPGKFACRLPAGFIVLFASLILLYGCHPGARQVRAPGSTMPQRNINTVLRAHDQELLAIPGVVGVYVGLQPDQKTPCLRVMVVKKTKDLEQAIPKSLEGYPVELEETGVIRPMQGR